MKKIIIASRWYKPAKNPRAFRTQELVDEFKRRGYEVTVFLPDDAVVPNDIRYIKVHHGRILSSRGKSVTIDSGLRKLFIKIIRNIFVFMFGDGPKTLWYAWSLYVKLKEHLKDENDYDAIISISYPFYINVVFAYLKKYISVNTVLIADCGDPFYANPSFKKAFYLKYLEKWTLRRFDYVAIPIESARKAYLDYISNNCIKVIPQGFKLLDIHPEVYKRNRVPLFGYAGIFYKSIRNPRYFFEYLLTVKQDFHFVVYAIADDFTASLLAEYKEKLKDKLEIRKAVDRDFLINEMATWEFVINFDNDNSNQRPSKLIDYAMSRRPIISFNQATFQADVFLKFLQGDYYGQEHVDLSQYDIGGVVDKFENLFYQR